MHLSCVVLLVAAIISSVAESRDPPCICLCLGVESGPREESKELFTQPLCCAGLSVCPAGSASAGGPLGAEAGRVGEREWGREGGRTERDKPAG